MQRLIRVQDALAGVKWVTSVKWAAALMLTVALLWPLAPATAAESPDAMAQMKAAGWFESAAMKLESEALWDAKMLPDTPAALAREWRSFDSHGSALGALVNLGWVALAAIIALLAEFGVSRGLSRRRRCSIRAHGGPALTCLLVLVLADAVGLTVFSGVFIYSRHWLMALGVTISLILFAANVLIRWRAAMLVFRMLLRPGEPMARLVDVPDAEARRLTRFLSVAVLAIVGLVGFGRYGLADVDNGAPHIIGLVVAGMVCAIYTALVYRARVIAEALIRGRSDGLIGAFRAAVARAWLPIGLTGVAALLVFFVFGLSLGLLSYYHAVVSTLGVLLVLLVFEQLAERGSGDVAAVAQQHESGQVEHLVAQSFQRIFRAIVLLVAALTIIWIWIDAIDLPEEQASRAMQSSVMAAATVFVAYVAWALARLAIDRHLPESAAGPRLPGADSEEELAPGSRLQTILPILRIGFGAVIAVVAALTVLSRLGIDTGPLIAGAGVFGLAISFGSQSLVRDIISGLFYIWDDAFRVGEYIDTGRLRGTVEALGIRSMKLRHHNGPLHTIPYGQLGAVTNLSRDFATVKFNLRLERGTDIELVRKTAKRIGIEMQEDPEIAGEVMLPLKMQGIAEITDTAIVLRFKFTARPIKPTWLQREYLKRMYSVFAEKDIVFASGALTLQTVPHRLEPAHAGNDSEAAGGAPSASLLLAEAAGVPMVTPAARVA
ncbi:MAG TPA: mechanosensitive ion channel domain-containing protein [Stellaceae bacterium]|jgi:small-conductance mechanosensitive channel|nr:mechanosensitive ion channel domain-containing protein [Stellaceae bacterium]